jgi:hypothetical protein
LQRTARSTSTNAGGTTRVITSQSLIGCVVLKNVFLFPEGHEPRVDSLFAFPKNVVSYKAYDSPLPTSFFLQINASASFPSLSIEEKVAIEHRAIDVMQKVFAHWTIEDVTTPEKAINVLGTLYPGYDYRARCGSIELHIEVKGTKLYEPTVMLSQNEIDTAAKDPLARLFVVRGIETTELDGNWVASGGTYNLYRWASLRELTSVLASFHTRGLVLAGGSWQLVVDKSNLVLSEDIKVP